METTGYTDQEDDLLKGDGSTGRNKTESFSRMLITRPDKDYNEFLSRLTLSLTGGIQIAGNDPWNVHLLSASFTTAVASRFPVHRSFLHDKN